VVYESDRFERRPCFLCGLFAFTLMLLGDRFVVSLADNSAILSNVSSLQSCDICRTDHSQSRSQPTDLAIIGPEFLEKGITLSSFRADRQNATRTCCNIQVKCLVYTSSRSLCSFLFFASASERR
jgi:hypothetical protein